MKIHIEIDCSPKEAREFMGLPDIADANALYVDGMMNAMKGAKSPEQMKDFIRDLAPMGQAGLKMMQNFLGASMAAAAATQSSANHGRDDEADNDDPAR